MVSARDRRTGFSRRRQYTAFVGYVLAVAGAAVGAVLLVLSTFNPPAFSAMRMGAAGLTTPVAGAFSGVARAVWSVPEAIGSYFLVHRENADLRRELGRVRPAVIRAQTLAYENRRLRRLLQIRERTAETVVVARLVSSTAASGRRFALLNAGRWQGVTPGMPVRAPDGLVGRITETGPNAARVLLLTDPESIVPIRRVRDGLPAIAAGRGDGLVDIRSVNATNIRFTAGDLFVTSGTGGLYAPDVPVALVLAKGIDTAMARPFASPDGFDVAIVARPFMPLPPRPTPTLAPSAPDAVP